LDSSLCKMAFTSSERRFHASSSTFTPPAGR
jgi:hypothetical protein